ncbi:hypothetical protein C8J56DRAFT_938604 [Mycena floridula]|nr:hypothetical protein C8J56DRAFT_938604 [Mycena floridula]
MWKDETFPDEQYNGIQDGEDGQEHVSRPPSSASSMAGDPGFEMDDNDSEEEEAKPAPSAFKKKHGKREQKVLNEKPRWESPEIDDVKPTAGGKTAKPDGLKSNGKKPTSGKEGEEARWPLVAQCIPYVHNKISITRQPTALRSIVTIGRKEAIGNMLTADPFSTSVDFKEKMEKMFLKIAKDSKQAEICERLKKDPAYMSAVCTIGTAIPVVVSHFRLAGLKVPDCQKKAASLCEENLFHYGVTEDGKVIDHQPFLNPVILEVLVLTWGKQFILRTYGKLFVSSFPDDPVKKEERELPAAMVALAATAVGSVLQDWRAGSRPHKYSDFDADNVAQFNSLFDTLNSIKTGNRVCYHRLMADLFIGTFSANTAPVTMNTNDAMSHIDFSKMAT